MCFDSRRRKLRRLTIAPRVFECTAFCARLRKSRSGQVCVLVITFQHVSTVKFHYAPFKSESFFLFTEDTRR